MMKKLLVCFLFAAILLSSSIAADTTGDDTSTDIGTSTGEITSSGTSTTTSTTSDVTATETEITTSTSTTGGPDPEVPTMTLTISGTVDGFNQTNFIEKLAQFLEIATSRIVVIDVTTRDIAIRFQFLNVGSGTPVATLIDTLRTAIETNSTAWQALGYEVVNFDVEDPNTPTSTGETSGGPEPTSASTTAVGGVVAPSSNDSGAIAGAVIGAVLGFMVLVSIGAIIYRRSKQSDNSRNLEAGIELAAPNKKGEDSDDESEDDDESEEDDDDDDESDAEDKKSEPKDEAKAETKTAVKKETSESDSESESSSSESDD